jgi:hypothetical protein
MVNDQSRGRAWRRDAILLLALLSAGSMWLYVRRVLVPYQRADAAAHDHPRGSLSDLYPRWLGARELLLHGRDPYSPAITREIQIGYYGRVIDSSRPGDPQDQQAFAYPVYVAFLLAPIVYIPFQIIHAPFYGVLAILTAVSVILWLRTLDWRPPRSTIFSLVLLVLGSMPVVQAIELQQLTLLVAFLVAGCVLLLVNGNFAGAGVLLAIATIKPQLVLPLLGWLMLWVVSDWSRRKRFLLGFVVAMGTLGAGAQWILPGWIPEFFQAVAAYRQYTYAASLFDALATAKWGPVLSAAISLMAAGVCWFLRQESEKSPRFVFASVLVLAVTLLVVPTVSTYNQVLLLPGIILLVYQGPRLWRKTRASRVVWTLAAATIFWPWIAALGLTVASFVLPSARIQQAWALPFYTSLAMPLAVLGLLFQYAFQILPSGPSPALAPDRR